MTIGLISAKTIASAKGVLRWISKVLGGHRVQVRIRVTLDTIKGLNLVSVLIHFDHIPASCATDDLVLT
jgi:hypothetical protein